MRIRSSLVDDNSLRHTPGVRNNNIYLFIYFNVMTYVTCYIGRISTKWEYRLANYIYLPTYLFELQLKQKKFQGH